MDGTAWPLPVVWAQAAGAAASSGATAAPVTLAASALRRWCSSLTLSSPGGVPGLSGVGAWLAGLAALLLLAAVVQGPFRALRQAFDLPGHARLVGSANRRLRRSGRMVAVVVGFTVLAFTGSQAITFRRGEGRDELLALTKARAPLELAFEQGALAGLTPLRDVAGLGSNLPLVLLASALAFRVTAEMFGGPPPPGAPRRPRVSGWVNVAWVCGTLLIFYRLVAIGSGNTDLPLGGCLMVEALAIPAMTAVCDGLLLGWVLVELRNAGLDDPEGDALDTRAAINLMPASVLAAVAALPARYLATGLWLASFYLPSSTSAGRVGDWLRWQLSWGLADVQAGALAVAGLAGAVGWGDGSPGRAVRGYLRLLRVEGARLAVVLALAGLAAAAASALAYLVVLALPTATWVLNAADAYAHFGSLPAGLWALSAMVELGERSLPTADLAPLDVADAASRDGPDGDPSAAGARAETGASAPA